MSIFRRLLGLDKGKSAPQGTWVQADAALTSRILGYFGRINDRDQIREAIARRYGSALKIEKDPDTGLETSVFVRNGFDVQMRAGMIETVSVGLGHKVSNALATLFNETTQNFSLIGPKGVDVSEASALLHELRGGDAYLDRLVQTDEESVQAGCAVPFVEFVDGRLRYRTIDPGKIQALFAPSVESSGQTRPTNYMDLEDAVCVVVETGSVDDTTKSFVAIFGRSDVNPNGRYVSYTSSGDGRDIPGKGDPNAWDFMIRDESGKQHYANPLSWYADAHPEMEVPEYPLAIFYGGHVKRDRLFPISASLYEDALEADIAASHVRATSNENAKATMVLTKSGDGAKQVIPKYLRGDVILEYGQKLEAIEVDTDGPKVSWELLHEGMMASAAGFTVPDFYVSSKDHTVEAASGVALKVRSGSLLKFRERRATENAPSVHKLFEIEKALISLFAKGDERVIGLLESCDQTWDPGEPELPENESDAINALSQLYDLGVIDTIEAIRRHYKLSSEAEAIKKYEKLKKRNQKYPPLASNPEPPPSE